MISQGIRRPRRWSSQRWTEAICATLVLLDWREMVGNPSQAHIFEVQYVNIGYETGVFLFTPLLRSRRWFPCSRTSEIPQDADILKVKWRTSMRPWSCTLWATATSLPFHTGRRAHQNRRRCGPAYFSTVCGKTSWAQRKPNPWSGFSLKESKGPPNPHPKFAFIGFTKNNSRFLKSIILKRGGKRRPK